MPSFTFSKEYKTLLLLIFLLSIVFGFNDNAAKFTISHWLKNFLYVFLLTAFTLTISLLGYKLAARYYESQVSLRFAHITRFGFSRTSELERVNIPGRKKIRSIYLGLLIAMLATLLSNGKVFFTALYSLETSTSRVGHRWRNLTQMQEAIIAFTGLLFLLLLIPFFSLLHLEKAILIATWLIIWGLLPIGHLPGGKIFFGSRIFYLFTAIFFALSLFLIPLLQAYITLPAAGIIAALLAFFYFKQVEYGYSK